jgi:uncharacterized protein
MTADASGDGLRDRLRRALPAAMKARDAPAVSALRSALAAIDNAEAIEKADGREVTPRAGTPPGTTPPAETTPPAGTGAPPFAGTVVGVGAAEAERRQLTGGQVRELLRAEVSDREAAAHAFEQAGQPERAERLRQEARVLSAYLEESS